MLYSPAALIAFYWRAQNESHAEVEPLYQSFPLSYSPISTELVEVNKYDPLSERNGEELIYW
jgi:hypothetical protein